MIATRIDLQQVIDFIAKLHTFQAVQRVVHVPDGSRYENDVEHSYILAMTAWYVIDTFHLPYNKDRAMRYALAHDLPEIYAGDTYIYSKDQEALASKKAREADAREQLVKDFPTVPDMHAAMEAYEQGTDPEAVFVRALDKLMPVITIYLGGGKTWKEHGITFEMAKENKRKSTAHVPEIAEVTEQLLTLLEINKKQLFGED